MIAHNARPGEYPDEQQLEPVLIEDIVFESFQISDSCYYYGLLMKNLVNDFWEQCLFFQNCL